VDMGAEAARAGGLVTFGVTPDRPETGYGYLELSAQPDPGGGAVPLASFREKPETATQLVGESGHIMVPEPGPGTNWSFKEGELTASTKRGGDSMLTPKAYGDMLMHVELNVNDNGSDNHEQNGNSGVYIQQRYELQITNCHGVSEEDFKPSYGGSLYRMKKPDKLVSKPAGEWQTMHVRLVGRDLTVSLNGETIHDKTLVEGFTAMVTDWHEDQPGPITLQGDHGEIQIRKVVVTPLAR